MDRLNTQAMDVPAPRLVEVLKDRIRRKEGILAERARTHGKDRVRIASYMENLALPELFGFDMNDLYRAPRLAIEVELRHRIFWADNSLDDGLPGLDLGATAGMYYDMTLFGEEVRHSPQGVPEFLPHPIAKRPDLALVPPFDFRTTGAMPGLLRQYEGMRRIAREEYGGAFRVGFPGFGRGPLDIGVQLRGYERFVADTAERPEFVHRFLAHIVGERARFVRERREFLGEAPPAQPTAGIDDDWVNVPFISPAIFREFVLPAYRRLQENEGTVNHFHTCGVMAPLVHDLLADLPGLRTLDVSGWNDFEALDRGIDPSIGFSLAFINSFVLCGTPDDHGEKLARVARVARHRTVSVCAQAIVRLHDDLAEDLRRMNAFITLARERLSQ